MLMSQSLLCKAGFLVSGYKKDKDNPHIGGSSSTYLDDVPLNQNVDITTLEIGVRGYGEAKNLNQTIKGILSLTPMSTQQH